MTSAVEGASNKPLERPAARIRSLAAAHWRRSPHGQMEEAWLHTKARRTSGHRENVAWEPPGLRTAGRY